MTLFGEWLQGIYYFAVSKKKKTFWFCLEGGLQVVGSYQKINYAFYFQLIYVLYVYFETQKILNSWTLPPPWGIPQAPRLKKKKIQKGTSSPEIMGIQNLGCNESGQEGLFGYCCSFSWACQGHRWANFRWWSYKHVFLFKWIRKFQNLRVCVTLKPWATVTEQKQRLQKHKY